MGVSIEILGGVGAGLVWGWLAALPTGRTRHPWLTLLAIGLASLLLAVEIGWFLSLPALFFSTGAGLISFGIHVAWRHQLRDQALNSIPRSGGQV